MATPLLIRNAMHYDGKVFERVGWSQRGAYMQRKHGIAPAIADEALEDPNRVVIDPERFKVGGNFVASGYIHEYELDRNGQTEALAITYSWAPNGAAHQRCGASSSRGCAGY